MRFFFRKNEKLTSEKEIDLLFSSGKSFFIYPIKAVFFSNQKNPFECKVLIGASKRYLKKAVERNLVKRRMREAYRSNSLELKNALIDKNISVSIAFIYTSSKIISYDKIEAIISLHIKKIVSRLVSSEKSI